MIYKQNMIKYRLSKRGDFVQEQNDFGVAFKSVKKNLYQGVKRSILN